jgi:DNA polymerase
MKDRITFDFETRSTCDLKKAGAYKYSLHPTTQPTCLSYKTREMKRPVLLKFDEINQSYGKLPFYVRNLWRTAILNETEFSAHNAFFETCIYKNILVHRYGWPDIPFRQFRCTAAKAAACALPRNLEGAGAAMGLRTQKDKRGYVAVMATCKPTRQWNAWNKKVQKRGGMRVFGEPEPPVFLEPDANPEMWETLYRYNVIDTLAEEELDKSIPDLNPEEQEIWFLNQQLNWRGLRVDIPTIRKIVSIMEAEGKTRLRELDSLTMGLITKPGARQSILDFLEQEGVKVPDIRAKTVDDLLTEGKLSAEAKKLLELRKALSKTSTRKYQAFLDRAHSDDGRVRDILLYHGASTGRDTGTGIQPHNFPRGIIKVSKANPYAAVENVIKEDTETLKLLYGENLSVLFSSILRNMIVPSVGKELFVADFSKIEVAVLWWLAGNKSGLRILNSGKDPYKYQAAANKGIAYDDVADEGDDRQLGKCQVLGCGFGMGWAKFQQTAMNAPYNLKLSDEQSKSAVYAYREANPAVPQLWKNYEYAALQAIEDKKSVTVNFCRFSVERKFLWITLPSGRRLAYREPSVGMRETDWGEQKTIEFWAVNSKTKKWSQERTWGGTLTENVVQAVARDLMMPAMLRLEKAGYQALLMVHDEGICEKEIGNGSIEEFVRILCERPKWANKDLPLDAKGWKGPRYRK